MQIKENTLAIAIFSLVMFVIGCIALTISITNNTEKLTEYDYSQETIEKWERQE